VQQVEDAPAVAVGVVHAAVYEVQVVVMADVPTFAVRR
jgi:hypothetical protein